MPTVIEVPGVGEVEFPDEMSEDQILTAVRGLHAEARKPKETPGDRVRKVVDPTYPKPGANLGDVGRQALLAGSLLVPNPAAGGALYGLSSSPELSKDPTTWTPDDLKSVLTRTGVSAAGGHLLAKAIKYGAKALGAGSLKVSPEAQVLEKQGVPLTTGQRTSSDNYKLLEQATAGQPFGLEKARQAAKDAWRVSEIKKAVKAGGDSLPADVEGAFGEAYKRFGPEYDAIRGVEVPGEALSGLPERALKAVEGIPDKVRNEASAAIRDALTVLPKGKPEVVSPLVDAAGAPIVSSPAIPPKVAAGDLMKVRSEVREALRAAVKTQDFDKVRQLSHAEDVVTGALEESLTPEAKAALQEIDRRYSKLMTIERAAPAGKVEFTPGQFLRSVENKAGRRTFKAGEAGEAQVSGQAAEEVFRELPKTGFVPGLLRTTGANYWGAPVTQFGNTNLGRKWLFGQVKPPSQTVGATGAAATPDYLSKVLADMLRTRLRLQTVPADEEAQ